MPTEKEAGIDGKVLFTGFAGTHDLGGFGLAVSARGGAFTAFQLCAKLEGIIPALELRECGSLRQQAIAGHESLAAR